MVERGCGSVCLVSPLSTTVSYAVLCIAPALCNPVTLSYEGSSGQCEQAVGRFIPGQSPSPLTLTGKFFFSPRVVRAVLYGWQLELLRKYLNFFRDFV